MKQNIKNAVLVILVGSTIFSCNKRLEEYNPSGATTNSLLKTPEGFETAVNATYTYNRSIFGKEEGYAMLEAGTDLWTAGSGNSGKSLNGIAPTAPFTTYLGLISDNQYLNTNYWVPCYAAINLCNAALKAINDAGLAPARKPVLEGELRFMRAWYYYLLVEQFGPVHFTLEPTEGMVTTANRTPVSDIYAQIVSDINFAIENLPPTTGDYGRVTKPAAIAFMARVALTTDKNQEASNYAFDVIKNYSFSLLTDYNDLWKISNERNVEVIWAVNYASNLALNAGSNEGHSMFNMAYSDLPGLETNIADGWPLARFMPTRFLLNLFDEQIDARYNASFRQAWIARKAATIPKWTAEEAAQNPALAALVGKDKFTVGDTAVFTSKYSINDFQQRYTTRYRYKTYDIDDMYNPNGTAKDRFHYPSLKKFEDPTRATANEAQSSRNAFVFRLAEMYMIAAEAQFKLGKLDSAAYFMNFVRRRAAQPGRQADMEVTGGSITLDFILDERAREFAGEQMRWFDLKRTNKLLERVKAYNPDAAVYLQDHHVLRPIPLSQILAVTNKKDFVQNPDY